MLSNKNIKDIYKLSPMQEGMYFQYLYNKDSHAYFEQTAYRINGDLQIALVEQSLNELLKRHDVLRTVFNHQKTGQPLQVVLKEARIDFNVEDASAILDKEAFVEQYKQRDIDRGFDLNSNLLIRVGILRLGSTEYEFIWSHHHIIMDGWCVGILIAEYLEIYNSLLENRQPRLGSVKPYKRYISWLGKQDTEAVKEYWKNYLRGYEQAVGIPRIKGGYDADKAFIPEVSSLCLSQGKTTGLAELAARKGVTLNTLIQSIWSVLLFKYNDVRDAVFGTVVSGRPSELEGVESMVGLFINSIPVRVKYEPGKNFSELLLTVQKKALESEQYHYYPLAAVQAESELRQNTINHMLVFENYPLTRRIEESNTLLREEATVNTLQLSQVKTFAQSPFHFQLTILPGSELEFLFQYNATTYRADCVATVARHLEYIIDMTLARNADFDIDGLSLTTAIDIELVTLFNATQAEYSANQTIVHLFEEQVDKTPHAQAVVLEDKKLTYYELNDQVNRLANLLRETYAIKAGSVVAVMTDRSEALPVGLLAVLKTGAAFVPIDPLLPQSRISYLLADSKPDILLTVTACAKRADEQLAAVLIDQGSADWPAKNVSTDATPEDLAYIIYTSGSTGRPKGVKIGHQALVNSIIGTGRVLNMSPYDRMLSITSCSFDPMLLDLFMPLITGACIVLAQEDKLKDPVRLQGIIDKVKPTFLQATPTMWSALLSNGWAGDSNLHVLCGGEDLNRELARRLVQSSASLWNLYGPTETTIWATLQRINANDLALPVGRPIQNVQVYVVDSNMRQQPVGVHGEICIGGHSVGKGYLNEPDLTAEKYVCNPFVPAAKLYRTGDLGRWLPDGTLEFAGRRDSQVKIMGNRIELGEIEATLMQYDSIDNAAVVAWKDKDVPPRLVAYFTGRERIELAALRNYLADALPTTLIPTYMVQLEKFPLTTSNKIDRKALPAPQTTSASRANTHVAARNETETKMVQLMAEALGTSTVGLHDNLFDYGLHSLTAIRLVHRISKELNVQLNVPLIFANPTVAGLCNALQLADQAESIDIPRVRDQSDYDLSHAQIRMWILHQFEENRAAYNVANAFQLKGDLNRDAFTRAFQTIIQRHESIRTCIIQVDGEPRQQINQYDPDMYRLVYEDLQTTADKVALVRQRVDAEATMPFNLEIGPLLRTRLIQLDKEEYIFSLVMHHIIADGWSLEVLFQEVLTLYSAFTEGNENPLPPLRIQYKDYAAWQIAQLKNDQLKKHQQYWWNQFNEQIPVLDIPTDYTRPPVKTANGSYTSTIINKTLMQALQALSQDQQATLYMTLMASVKLLMFKYSGQEDIVLGSAVAGRSQNELYNQVGFFVNTVALRTIFAGDEDFRSLLGKVKETIMGAFAHQSYPFDRLVDELNLPRTMSRSPLFDVMVSLHNTDVENASIPGLKGIGVSTYGNTVVSKYDLVFHFKEMGDGIALTVDYNTDLFRNTTIQRMVAHYLELLKELVSHLTTPIKNLSCLLPDEKQQISAFLQTPMSSTFPNTWVHQQIAARSAAAPQAVALRVENRTITYADLNDRSNKLANYLIGRYGLNPDDVVGINVAKLETLIVVTLAVLKTGAIYLPLGPDLSSGQIAYITENKPLRTVITEGDRELLVTDTIELVRMEAIGEEVALCSDKDPCRGQPMASLHYLFVDGETPRQLITSHEVLLTEAAWLQQQYGLSLDDTVLSADGWQAEALTRRCLAVMACGAGMVLQVSRQRLGPATLLSYVNRYNVTTLFINSVGYADFLNTLAEGSSEKTKSLKHVIAVGELLPREVLQRHRARLSVPLHLDCTFTSAPGYLSYRYGPENEFVMPLGRPGAGIRLCLLDSFGNPVPAGVVGELYMPKPNMALPVPGRDDIARLLRDALATGELIRTRSLGRWQLTVHADAAEIELYGTADDSGIRNSLRMHGHQVATSMFKNDGVDYALVINRKDREAKDQLVAYYTSYDGNDITDLPGYFTTLYPSNLVPSHFVRIDGFPLTANGRIDLSALPQDLSVLAARTYVAPRTDLEKKLAQMLMEVMGIEKLGVYENFFDSGFHSLKAIFLIGRIYKEFGLQLNMAKIFANPSVVGLGQLVESSGQKAAPVGLASLPV